MLKKMGLVPSNSNYQNCFYQPMKQINNDISTQQNWQDIQQMYIDSNCIIFL